MIVRLKIHGVKEYNANLEFSWSMIKAWLLLKLFLIPTVFRNHRVQGKIVDVWFVDIISLFGELDIPHEIQELNKL